MKTILYSSHCGAEGALIASAVAEEMDLPVLEIEVPPVSDALRATLRTRLEALVETVSGRRARRPGGGALGGRAPAARPVGRQLVGGKSAGGQSDRAAPPEERR